MQPDWAGVPHSLIVEVQPYVDLGGLVVPEDSIFREMLADRDFGAALTAMISIAAAEEAELPTELLNRIDEAIAGAGEGAFIDAFYENLQTLRSVASDWVASDWIGFSREIEDEVEQLVNAAGGSDANKEFVFEFQAQGLSDLAFECLISEAAELKVRFPVRLLDQIDAEFVEADDEAFSDQFVENLRTLRLIAG